MFTECAFWAGHTVSHLGNADGNSTHILRESPSNKEEKLTCPRYVRKMHAGCREVEGGDGRGPLHDDGTYTKGKGTAQSSGWRGRQGVSPDLHGTP